MIRTKTRQLAVLAAAVAMAAGVQAADKNYPGQVKVSLYKNIGGTAVGDLTGNAKYPNNPDEIRFFTVADVGQGLGDNYGGVMEFLWTASTTGNVQFAIAADDGAELWVSTDETPANLKKVASEPQWNGTRSFGADTRRPGCAGNGGGQTPCENVSPPVPVQTGRKYLIRGLWKEGGGGDNYAVAVLPAGEQFANDTPAIDSSAVSVNASDTPAVLSVAATSQSWVYIGGTVSATYAPYVPPGGTFTTQWYKDGAAIAGATDTAVSYKTVAADAGKTIKLTAKMTAGGSTIESTAVSFQVIDPGPLVDSPGYLTMDVWTGLPTGDNSIDNTLLLDPDYPTTPDFTSYTSSFSSRPVYTDDSHEGYGGRISGFIIPKETGQYRFFLYSDDSSRLYLSVDDKPANAQQIAEETGCCNNFTEPDSPRTSEPQSLVANRRYYVEAIWKEGTGGDYLNVAWRKEGDTTAAGSLPVIARQYLLTKAPAGGVTVTFTTQPVASAELEVGKSMTLTAAATAFPINSAGYQWQKDGADIAGATGTSYKVPTAVAGDVGKTAKYKLVATTLGNVKGSSSEAAITTVADTKPPQITKAGTVKKGSKIEIGLAFNEGVDAASAGDKANYSLSAGTVDSVRYVRPKGTQLASGSSVIVASGLTAGQTVTVSVKGVKDGAGNAIPAATPATKDVKVTGTYIWVGVGGNDINDARGNTDYSDDVAALGASAKYENAYDFDLISGGSGNWNAYDEATYVYEEITGNFDRVVRIEYQDPTSQWSRAGLHVREALDEGTTRADAESQAKPMSRNLAVRFSAPVQASGAAANNAYEVIDRNLEGGNYRGTPGGFGGAPNYPNAWCRIARVGGDLKFWKSNDGTTWTNEGTLAWTEPNLAAKLYVGMYYAPEYNNNDVLNLLAGSAVAQFRDYGTFPLKAITGGGPVGPLAITRTATAVSIAYDAGTTLESSASVTSGWAPVAGAANPHVISNPTGTTYFRSKR